MQPMWQRLFNPAPSTGNDKLVFLLLWEENLCFDLSLGLKASMFLLSLLTLHVCCLFCPFLFHTCSYEENVIPDIMNQSHSFQKSTGSWGFWRDGKWGLTVPRYSYVWMVPARAGMTSESSYSGCREIPLASESILFPRGPSLAFNSLCDNCHIT